MHPLPIICRRLKGSKILSDNMPLRMPGATLMTRLKVYDTVTPDSQRGGTPHVHLLCTEMYFCAVWTWFCGK